MYRKNISAILEAWNTGKLDTLDEFVSREAVRHGPVTTNSSVNSIEELKSLITDFRASFPDLKIVLDEEIYIEGRSVIRWTFSGTNTGPGRFGPTGKTVRISGASIAHYADEQMIEEYVLYDTADFYTQLGLMEMSQAATG